MRVLGNRVSGGAFVCPVCKGHIRPSLKPGYDVERFDCWACGYAVEISLSGRRKVINDPRFAPNKAEQDLWMDRIYGLDCGRDAHSPQELGQDGQAPSHCGPSIFTKRTVREADPHG